MRQLRNITRGIALILVIVMGGFYLFNSGKPIKQVFRASYMQENIFTNRLLGISFELPKGWENSLLSGVELKGETILLVDINKPETVSSIQMIVAKPNFFNAFLSSKMWLEELRAEFKEAGKGGGIEKSYKIKEDIKEVDLGNKNGHKITYSAGDDLMEQCYYAYKVKGYVFVIITTKEKLDTINMEEIIANVNFEYVRN